MNDQQRRIHWPALGAATAIALAVTLGLPAAMSAGTAPDGYLSTLAASNATPATQVAIAPARIDVIAVREHATVRGFFSFAAHKRAS